MKKMSPQNVFITYGFFPTKFSLRLCAFAVCGGAPIDCNSNTTNFSTSSSLDSAEHVEAEVK